MYMNLHAQPFALVSLHRSQFVHVIDLSGPAAHPWQWLKLMRAFHGRPGGSPQLRITVVHDDGAFLAQTAALLRREAEALDMAFSFHPILGRLETLELGNLHHTLAIRSGDARAFSCVLQMHRLLAVDDTQQVARSMAPLPQLAAPEVVKTSLLDPSQTTPLSPFTAQASPSASSPEHPQRAAAVVPPLAGFLSAVRAVSPKVVCVMEQDAGDNVADLAARFEEALHHYAAVFEAMDDAAAGEAHRAREEERAAVDRVLLWEHDAAWWSATTPAPAAPGAPSRWPSRSSPTPARRVRTTSSPSSASSTASATSISYASSVS